MVVSDNRRVTFRNKQIERLCTESAMLDVLGGIADKKIEQIGVDQNGIPLYIVDVGTGANAQRLLISFHMTTRTRMVVKKTKLMMRTSHSRGKKKKPRKVKETLTLASVRIKNLDALAIAEAWAKDNGPDDTLLGNFRNIKSMELKMPLAGERAWKDVG
ncbi:MAG TPA: hypothetical protein QF873_01210 [Patescibacteria group bacterium]|nr:hypothetical protein [Patescibacteria group bacterium]